MQELQITPTEFKNEIQPLLLMEGIKFTYKIVKGLVVLSVPFFFLDKYGFI